jgi:hypothetical protein
MLKIAERIFLSPELKIDDIIIKSKFGGDSVVADLFRTHRALIKGEYDRFSEGENEFISNLFQTNAQRPGPPLLGYYILWLLRQKLNSVQIEDDNVESRHWLATDMCQLFEGCGVDEDLVMNSLNRLYDRRLIEALDPNAKHVSIADKVAIKESGLAHLELILTSVVYVEQMALVTGLNELFARDEIKKNLLKSNFNDVREAFLQYVMKIDSGRLGILSNAVYSQINKARAQIDRLTASGRRARAQATG